MSLEQTANILLAIAGKNVMRYKETTEKTPPEVIKQRKAWREAWRRQQNRKAK